ncbi:MAG: T9SS type A sorting domain-containing protein [Caldisericaceae bacterium]|nr:T9SS type A sorting domain-containing protein [Caldisericaceae bacterium]
MKRLLLLWFSLFLVITLAWANEKPRPVYPQKQKTTLDFKVPKTQLERQKNEIQSVNQFGFEGGVIFEEHFEPSGTWHRWQAIDLTHPRPEHGPSYWHITTWNAMDSTCWWLADTTLGDVGGYANHWYQVLDTPPFMVSDTNAYLMFYQRFNIEGTAGAEAPYDGWDAMNVRISYDSGKTWQVLPFNDYDMQNSWAFGHPSQGQNEGLGIPGWSGEQLDWRKEMISLKDFVKPNTAIMLRFAFASDMGYSTADPWDGLDSSGTALFGWQIDSIMVASNDSVYFFNNGEEDGMMGKDVEFIPPEGGNLWHVAEFLEDMDAYLPEFAPSPTHFAIAQNSGDTFDPFATYNPYMDNVFQTGPIALPDTTPIYLDFTHLPFFADEDEFPNVEYWRVDVKAVDSTEWEAVWIGPNGEQWVFSDGFDQWVWFSYFFGYPSNMSPLELSRYAGQDIYLRWHFWSDEDEPIGFGLAFDDIVIYAPVKTIEPPTGLEVMAGPVDTTISVQWDMQEEGRVVQVWRTTPGDQYLHLIAEVSDTNAFVDTDIEPFQLYYYTLRTVVLYEGTSDFAEPLVGTEVIPATVWELAYDRSMPDTVVEAPKNKLVYVKFTPIAYPMDLIGFKVALDTTGTNVVGAYQFTFWDDDGVDSLPGTKLRYVNKSGLGYGYNRIIFDDSIAVDSGSIYIGLKRFGNAPKIFAESDSVDGHTYVDTDTGTIVPVDLDALVHAYFDTSRTEFPTGIHDRNMPLVADRYYLGKNYPNPFNPTTTIPFVIPDYARGQKVKINVYNVLGQKVATIFNGVARVGLNTVTWDGKNSSGRPVGSGIYIYQLKGKNVSLQRRMLLIK